MNESIIFKTPDVEIQKQILQGGKWGIKPYEYSLCNIILEHDQIDVKKYNSSPLVLGNSSNDFERSLDICLATMYEEEVAKFTVVADSTTSFTVHLIKIDFQDFIHKWDANKKYKIALYHKDKGVELFKNEKIKQSAYRFTKALRIILSIPLDVEEPPPEVDGLSIDKVNLLKVNLFNNMASCYLKNEVWPMVIEFCKKVLSFDKDNIKALYKIGVAYRYDRNFELAKNSLEKVIALEPTHSAAEKHLSSVKIKLKEADDRVDCMMKKMFQGVTDYSLNNNS